jgi:methyl-accepting chemotaxis protein
MRVLGFPIESPQTVVNRALSDVAAIARLARTVPTQFERMLTLGEEMVAIGHGVLDIAERLDRRAEAVLSIGERLDAQATELVDLGSHMQKLGAQVDARGAEIVDRATRVVETGSELIGVLPALERALEMASPLEGAIDRFGRLVDRLPGGVARRPTSATAETPGGEQAAPASGRRREAEG